MTTVPPVVEPAWGAPETAAPATTMARPLTVGGEGGARNVKWSEAVSGLVPLSVLMTMSAVAPPEGGTPTNAGVVTVRLPSAFETTNVAGWETCPTTNVTDCTPVRFVPVMVRRSPPALEPLVALRPVIVGVVEGAAGPAVADEPLVAAAKYVNWSAAEVAEVPAALVTVMSATAPPEGGTPTYAGATTRIELSESTRNWVAEMD